MFPENNECLDLYGLKLYRNKLLYKFSLTPKTEGQIFRVKNRFFKVYRRYLPFVYLVTEYKPHLINR
jgi:hypothetical protein